MPHGLSDFGEPAPPPGLSRGLRYPGLGLTPLMPLGVATYGFDAPPPPPLLMGGLRGDGGSERADSAMAVEAPPRGE